MSRMRSCLCDAGAPGPPPRVGLPALPPRPRLRPLRLCGRNALDEVLGPD